MGPLSTALPESQDIAWFRDSESLPVAARSAATALARRIGLGDQRAAEVALAITEAATNLRRHAVDGSLLLRVLRTEEDAAVEFLTLDNGPGMRDIPYAMADGTSSAGTLGIGLGAIARLADTFDVHSLPDRGTVLVARFWGRGRVPAAAAPGSLGVAGLTRPISGEESCGDAWAARWAAGPAGPDRALLVMFCDGLGHGPLAAVASQRAVAAFRAGTAEAPADVLTGIHHALNGTRGGAAAVVRIEPAAGRVRFCGVGNISGFTSDPQKRHALLSAPGIVGHQLPTLRTHEQPLPPDGAVVLHSDGLTERWQPAALPGLLRHLPVVTAGLLLREAGVRRDDAGVVVARVLR
ncbi:SpoIIE family protein phosphatase [Kitasatospora sp. NBC_01287]|uniref:ATP-binding protein n=1 Tax=Kitasatospora sp. NBC_01287 TaxID=2903573 RepID=UPI0022576128|nr:SpoIIE family protein phosphatase [Kitasatospora sp. NBC_01287]MCX4744619.1 SpoIIE family protein phosphatase [Kitasatospora sp. NBC_01287]